MSKEKISCGGFFVDGETIIIEDGILKSAGGSYDSPFFVVHFHQDDDTSTTTCDKTYAEILAAVSEGKIPVAYATFVLEGATEYWGSAPLIWYADPSGADGFGASMIVIMKMSSEADMTMEVGTFFVGENELTPVTYTAGSYVLTPVQEG